MENSYGIGVRNRYALFLDDESDPLEVLKKQEQEKEQKKKSKVAEKENKVKVEPVVKGKSTAVPKKVPKEIPNNKAPDNKREEAKPAQRPNTENKPDRNSNRINNESREERNNRRNREDRQYNGPAEGNRERDREERPRRDNLGENFENRNRNRTAGSKQGGARGGPRRNFDERRGKREFDRQSGSDKTGVKPVEKRDGGGAHNWGSHKDIIEEADKVNEVDPAWGDEKNDSGVVVEVKEGTEPEAEPVPTEEEPKEMTLDEWKAQRAGRQKPQYNLRKAGEGEDPNQWKKMYELNKKKEEEGLLFQDTDDEEYDPVEYPQRVGRQKHVLDIDIHFNDARRGGTGGRGRGPRANRGSRGNRDRQGGATGGRFRANDEQGDDNAQRTDKTPKVDDERDFPSLG